MQEYCEHCGTELVVTRRYVSRYDAMTGEPVIFVRKDCPKRKWYQVWHQITRSF